MRKKTLLTALAISALLISIGEVQFVEEAKANFLPEIPPAGIQIESDGPVTGTSNLQRNESRYTFTGNIDGPIVVLRDNIVIDGQGYALRGQGDSPGIFIQERANVTVKHIQISNFSSGIRITFGASANPKNTNITILENNIINNGVGIYLSLFSGNNSILGNNVTGNGKGISVNYSNGNTLRNNRLSDNEYNLWVDCLLSNSGSAFINDIDPSNTVDGKPVHYWVGETNRAVPSDAGYVALIRCSGIIVEGLTLSHNGQGVLLVETNNSKVTQNHITQNNYGVALFGMYSPCTNNNVTQNRMSNNTQDIFTYLEGSTNTIENNSPDTTIPTPTSSYAIMIKADGSVDPHTSPIIVEGNLYTLTANIAGGIQVQKSNIVVDGAGYTLFGNGSICLNLSDVNNVTVKNLRIKHCSVGVYAVRMVNCTFYANHVEDCSQECFFLLGNCSYNTITYCTIIGLNPVSMNYMSNYNTVTQNNLTGTVIIWLSGYVTVDNNFWGDYFTKYPNASEIGTSGIGDTPYVFWIAENGTTPITYQDNHPLVRPIIISEPFPTPTPWATPSNSPTPSPSSSPVPSSTQQPTLEPTLAPTPTSDDSQAADWTPTVLAVVVVAAVAVGALVYFRRRRK